MKLSRADKQRAIQENNTLNGIIIDYCRKIKKMTGYPPNENELGGYITFKAPYIKGIAMKAKIKAITGSKAYRKLR